MRTIALLLILAAIAASQPHHWLCQAATFIIRRTTGRSRPVIIQEKEHAEMEDILSAAEELLGPAVRVETHPNWAIFWCPFHGDEDRAGQGGQPNFGIHIVEGYWKCLR